MAIDQKQFEKHLLEPASSFEILLRGHLWIENLVNRILEVHIVEPSAIDLDRMAFRQKIDVAQAFGFISPEDGHAFKKLNRLRNKLAHNVMAEPSESEIKDLIDTLAGNAKAAFDAIMKAPDATKRDSALLGYWFYCYAIHLGYLCAMRRYEKDSKVKLMQVEAVRYVSKKLGRKEITIEEARRQFDLPDPPSPKDTWR